MHQILRLLYIAINSIIHLHLASFYAQNTF